MIILGDLQSIGNKNPLGGSGGITDINLLSELSQEVNLANSLLYTVVADAAARLALPTPYDRFVFQTDTSELWYYDEIGLAWVLITDTPVYRHFVDAGIAKHELLLPDYPLLKILGDTIYEIEIFENIAAGTAGTVSLSAHSTIVLDQYEDAGDCLITRTDSNGRPIDEPARDSGGNIITGTLDIAGNYILSGTPAAYPVSIIFQIQIMARYRQAEISNSQILNESEIPTAEKTVYDNTITGEPDNNVQDVIDDLVFSNRKKVNNFLTDVEYPFKKIYGGVVRLANDEATLIAAIAAAVDYDVIRITADITLTSTLIINKALRITGGFILQSAGGAGDPVTLINITSNNVYIDNTITIKHRKTTNTSVESAVNLASVTGFISEAFIEFMEAGYVLRGSWNISGVVNYTGALGNNHRCFIPYNVADNSIIHNVTFDFPIEATPRNSFVYLTSGGAGDQFNGILKIESCYQFDMSKIARQFYLQDAYVSSAANGLIVENCQFNELNGDIGLFGAAGQNVLDFFVFVAIINNYSGEAAYNANIYKGVFYMDGSGAIHNYGATNFYYSGNYHARFLRSDYSSAYDDGGITYKNTAYDNSLPVVPIKNIIDNEIYNWQAQITNNLADVMYDRQINRDPTGFTFPENITINYDNVARTVTLTNITEAFYRGKKINVLTSGWVSSAHPITLDHVYFLYYDGGQFLWADNTYPGFDKLLIAFVYYGTLQKYAIRECHGVMSWSVHSDLHYNIGTYKESGGLFSSYILQSTTPVDRRPDISVTTIGDEDLSTILAALTTKTYTNTYLTTTGITTYALAAAEIIPVQTNNPYYNLYSAPNWVQLLLPANSLASVWIYAVPVTSDANSQSFRYLFIQPQWYTQAQNSSAPAILAAVNSEAARLPSELNLGTLGVEATEFVAIARIIISYHTLNWQLERVTLLSGNKFSQIGSPSIGVIPHSSLSGLNNDDHINYAWLPGRNGGQILNGGDQPNDNLRLRSTTDGTKGNVYIDDTAWVDNDLYTKRLLGLGYYIGIILDRFHAVKNNGWNIVQGLTNITEITSYNDDIIGLATADVVSSNPAQYIRHGILATNLNTAAATVGDPVYVDNTGLLTLAVTPRQVGTVADLSGRVFVNLSSGTGGAAEVANNYGRLAGLNVDGAINLIDTDLSLYTVPAITYTRPASVFICNRNNAVVSVRLAHVDGAIGVVSNEDYIFYDTLFQPYETKIVGIPGMQAADSLLVRSDTTNITFSLNGEEFLSDGLKRLAAITVVADTDTALYSATGNVERITIVACNKDAINSADIRIGIINGAIGAWNDDDYILDSEILLEAESKSYSFDIALKNTETIGVRSTDADVNFILYGKVL